MIKPIIKAISFFFKEERIILYCRADGKFRVPVTRKKDAELSTRYENLTARQVINHQIIKHCDPTLYLERNDKLRVFEGGDSGYLPATADGVITKHDALYKQKKKKVIPKTLNIKARKGTTLNDAYNDYMQTGLFGDWNHYDRDYDDYDDS
ncbi:MAG TPA: hypothetical protein DCM40_09695 [Maribacter sp.]|nr:hypothetical protein [Maribacter sp.]